MSVVPASSGLRVVGSWTKNFNVECALLVYMTWQWQCVFVGKARAVESVKNTDQTVARAQCAVHLQFSHGGCVRGGSTQCGYLVIAPKVVRKPML